MKMFVFFNVLGYDFKINILFSLDTTQFDMCVSICKYKIINY